MIETSHIVAILWQQAGWVIAALLFLGGLKLSVVPKLKGLMGEAVVRARLKGLAVDEIHDCILPDGRGGMTQIDHLYLTGNGIRVIETKNYGGRIFGTARQNTWTQRLGRGSIRIPNPLRQNWGHAQAVKALVGEGVPVHGHVVVGGRAEFPKGVPTGVQRPRELAAELRAEAAEGPPPQAWNSAWQELQAATRSDAAARKAHRAALARKFGADKATSVGMVMVSAGVIVGVLYMLSTQG